MTHYTPRPVLDGDRSSSDVYLKVGNVYKEPLYYNTGDKDHPIYGQLRLLKLFYRTLLHYGNFETKMCMDKMTKTKPG